MNTVLDLQDASKIDSTKLAVTFEVFNDEREALRGFFPGRALQRFDVLNFVLAAVISIEFGARR